MKEKIYIKDFLNILLNHKKALIFIMFGSVMGMIQLSFVLTQQIFEQMLGVRRVDVK